MHHCPQPEKHLGQAMRDLSRAIPCIAQGYEDMQEASYAKLLSSLDELKESLLGGAVRRLLASPHAGYEPVAVLPL
jgi:hypothetical protein